MALTDTAWLHSVGDPPDSRLQLVCLPYAGSLVPPFLDWAPHLPPRVAMLSAQLPGRGPSHGTPEPKSIPEMAEALVDPLLECLRGPFALFGHSMGALISFELARALEDLGAPLRRLFVSSYRAPQLPMGRRQLHLAPDTELVGHLDVLSDGSLRDSRDVAEYLLPILRRDLRLCETYEFTGGTPLRTPITAFHGVEDPLFSNAEVQRWCELTEAEFAFFEFPGGHFHVKESKREVLAHVLREADSVR
ncbi:alpha/beta fold hydrolase [Nocardiopsis sp. NPDC049922]|uniref:thioesterase II family protein n=1 Tax=Nocardiopsis sp. NPDC049922 TaxID=3155157 RepID=UPI0033C0F143